MSELPPVESAPPQGGQHLPNNPIPRPGGGEQLSAGDPLTPPARYDSPHRGEPDERDPGFCHCGLGLDAYVHTDSTRYVATPLTADVWQDLRGEPA